MLPRHVKYRGKTMNNKTNLTENKSKYGQPLYKCAECKNEFTATYWLISAELCWDCYGDYKC